MSSSDNAVAQCCTGLMASTAVTILPFSGLLSGEAVSLGAMPQPRYKPQASPVM